MKLELENSKNVFLSETEKISKNDLIKIKNQFKLKDESNEEIYKKILDSLGVLVEGQKVTQTDLQLGLIGLAKQNSELLDLNRELNQQLEIVVSEFNAIKKEREEKVGRREKLAKRKRLPKRDLISSETYNLLIKENESPSYIATRTRIALCLLTVTGVRISELLPLKVGQLKTLLEDGWISIDRLKQGPGNHNASRICHLDLNERHFIQ